MSVLPEQESGHTNTYFWIGNVLWIYFWSIYYTYALPIYLLNIKYTSLWHSQKAAHLTDLLCQQRVCDFEQAVTKFANDDFKGRLEKTECMIAKNNEMQIIIINDETLNWGHCVKLWSSNSTSFHIQAHNRGCSGQPPGDQPRITDTTEKFNLK